MTTGDSPADVSANLRNWADAAAAGGFPAPLRSDRWQALRAGVVGLWEFDITEYWYANGWVQFIGRNETGKSSLMALTTLIPWLADTASSNIDTLGRSGKKFRYYVEPTRADGDRRSSEASTHRGWLWVEYGRLVDDAPTYFTTLLFAETRSAATDVKLSWCTVEGSARVRESIDLAPQRIVASPKELNPTGWISHTRGTDYRKHVATRLLGSTPERLESVGKMLKVTRTPKLGAQLEIGFVQQHLRAALPELNRAEVDALAGGWDQLDQIRADLASTKEAADTLERFRRNGWLPWARAAVRHRADLAGSARTVLDNVTRDEVAAREALERCQAAQAAKSQAATDSRQTAEGARAAADQLQASARYQNAHDRVTLLDRHRARRADLARRLQQDQADRDRAADLEGRERTDAARAAEAVQEKSAEADMRRDAFGDAAARELIDLPSAEVDLAWAGQALTERRQVIDSALQQASDAAAADAQATTAEERAGELRDQARRDVGAADAAWSTAEEARDILGQAILSWTAGTEPRVSGDTVERWLSGLPVTAEALSDTTLDDSIRAEWFEPARSALLIDKDRAQQRRSSAQAESSRINAEITDLESTGTPPFPAPVGWNRRERPPSSPAGAPLWALTDPRAGVTEAELAGLEAALAAASLLDAWVTPDGIFSAERDGNDLVITPAPVVSGPSLADVLRAADGDQALGRVVAGLLAGIALVPAAGDPVAIPGGAPDPVGTTLMISPDGRWWSSGLSGRAGAQHDHPEWIGESARARRRQRRIEELIEQRAAWLAAAESAAADEAVASAALIALDATMDRRPRDGDLRAALFLATERDQVATRSKSTADQAETTARRLRTRADELRAELARFCTEKRLPTGGDDLRRVATALVAAAHLLERYGQSLERLDDARRVFAQAEQRSAQARTHRESLDERVNRTSGEHREADATVATLETTIDADDREILDELERLKATERDAVHLHAALETDLRRLGEELGGARELLAGTEKQREEARLSRDSAYAAFRRLLDRGLGSELGLTFGDTTAAGAERIRAQVAVARRELSPPRWPVDTADQESMVNQLALDLVELATNETRIRLEASGRTLRIENEHGLPVVEVLVDSTGVPLGPRAAAVRLGEIHDELAASYSQRVQETLDELLGSTFLEHLRSQVGATQTLINQINQVLAKHPVVTTKTSLKIVLEPASASDAAMLAAVSGPELANPDVAGLVRDRLRERVEDAKRLAEAEGDADWRNRLAQQLDYRGWFDVHLRKRIGSDGGWTPLTTQGFAEMSGGARAVILMLPLVATLAALYEDMAGSPRPLWLDEAFDGLDSLNREMVMDLFGSFDFDVLLAGPARLVNVRAVPAAAIYQVVRAPEPMPGVDLTLELWAGGDLQQIELPTTLPSGPGGPSGPTEGTLL